MGFVALLYKDLSHLFRFEKTVLSLGFKDLFCCFRGFGVILATL